MEAFGPAEGGIGAGGVGVLSGMSTAGESSLLEQPKIRFNFPETWIWSDVHCG